MKQVLPRLRRPVLLVVVVQLEVNVLFLEEDEHDGLSVRGEIENSDFWIEERRERDFERDAMDFLVEERSSAALIL